MALPASRTSRNEHGPRIPEFTSIEEAAAFWDAHDSTEFEDEWEEVTDVRFQAAIPQEGIWLQFDDATLLALTERARALNLSPKTLARRWVLERLSLESMGQRPEV
jgi:hypothetical protein